MRALTDRFLPRLSCVLMASLAATAATAQAPPPEAPSRARVISALEQLMMTGEPQHTDHDEGEWLQAEVNAAIARGDVNLYQLARRAAAPLIPSVSRPVSPINDFPRLSVDSSEVLELPRPVRFTAEIYASIDGGEVFLLRTVRPGTSSDHVEYPTYARRPGVHHVRLQAHIVYEKDGGLELPPETRNLPDLAYALYDPAAVGQYDARVFVTSPAYAKANSLDPHLPDVRFDAWLAETLAKHGASSDPRHWRSTFCDERVVESGISPRSGALCTVAYFEAKGTIGRIWFRTGRIEFTGGKASWAAEAPALEALQLRRSDWSETNTLASLPALLEAPEHVWPRSDVSVAPENIAVDVDRGTMSISAVIRNVGNMDARGVYVMVMTGVPPSNGTLRRFVVDIPARGDAVVRLTQPTALPYGVVMVQTMQASEHTPFDSWTPDPTPEDAVAFRVFNPRLAPTDYARVILEMCGWMCRGY